MQTDAHRDGTILIVDDDDGVRRVLARWVADMGYVVESAADADSAITVMGTTPIDVIVSDVRMPGHDGIWLLGQVRRYYPSVAVVLATGLIEMDPSVTLRQGVAAHILKPFNRAELEQAVRHGMSERRRLQEVPPLELRRLSASVLEGIVVARG